MVGCTNVQDRNLFFGWHLELASAARAADTAPLRNQASPPGDDFRSATEAGEAVENVTTDYVGDNRLPLRTRFFVIFGLALLSWLVVGGMLAWLL
jgi:hypothetical protein